MRLALLCLVLAILVGCSTVTIKQPGGWELSYSRLWYEVDDFSVSIPGVGTASVGKVSNDTEALKAMLPLMVKFIYEQEMKKLPTLEQRMMQGK